MHKSFEFRELSLLFVLKIRAVPKKFTFFEDVISMQKEIIEIRQRLDGFLVVLDKVLNENSSNHSISLSNIFQIVCDEHGVGVFKALSDSRKKEYVQCRNIYSQISVDVCGYDISEAMDYVQRDRSSYYNAIKNHEAFMSNDEKYAEKYNSVLDKIKKYQDEKRKSES